MGKDNNVIKLAFTGSTKLTLKGMGQVLKLSKFKIVGLYGLNDQKLSSKVNSVNMGKFCHDNNITLNKTEDWNSFYYFCLQNKVDMIITLGDSRIIPKNIVNKFEVIGNHGAVLPYVQGAASLVWGRMLNSGNWGVSIMRIGEKIDSGEILKTKNFTYTNSTTEEEFVSMADNITIEILLEVLNGDFAPKENNRWNIKIAKHTDSFTVKQILEFCLKNNLSVYLPPRTPEDSVVKNQWPEEFKVNFKKSNDFPYPKWSDQE